MKVFRISATGRRRTLLGSKLQATAVRNVIGDSSTGSVQFEPAEDGTYVLVEFSREEWESIKVRLDLHFASIRE